ncbi:AEC family transporter [Uliginosibacterium aquaticum]|uniref:AEC family transporter n=1 Tax=Uliginosibacterium aquaticum TaxID=2731212 RepID=A0ABX2IIL6_9RHOO|nr:AEC family transporter [Uliginosibacterium aquaticum]NSL56624.1 AEC family transporter [Uliginosibacterium aquaticum]
MQLFLDRLAAASPLFVLIFAGYAIVRWGGWPRSVADALTRFVFGLALPALLFHTMSDFSKLPAVDARLLIAFFGGALIVFVLGRVMAARIFHLDGVSGSIFALGCIFSNNVMLGLPLAKATLGDAALPSVALVLVFNALTLWTLVTVSIEWAQHGEFSVKGFAKTARSVITNPIVAAIVSGTLYGLTGLPLPHLVAQPLAMVGAAATPMALVVLGMGLAEYSVREGLTQSLTVCLMKLIVLPLVVGLLAWGLGLPKMETQVVVLLSSMAMGVNVYLMSRQFKVFEAPTAAGMVLSTLLAAVTTPVVLTVIEALG